MSSSARYLSLLGTFLRPFSWLYGSITDFRNRCYDNGWLAVTQPPCRTISIGNLTVGGTGKTPMIEALVRLLRSRHRIAIVSRGYGRKSKGLVIASDDRLVQEIGDEPMQFYRKFTPDVKVIVAEKRTEAARLIATDFPEINLLLLDDAYQHRAIDRHVNILLTDYNRLFYKDHPFPSGLLRERRKGARRADIIVVTKCPHPLSALEKQTIANKIHAYSLPTTPVFFTSIRYGAPIPFSGNAQINDFHDRIGLSGLAQNAPFENLLREKYAIKRFKGFPDHYRYSTKELSDTELLQSPDIALLTTEKDMVKLLPETKQLGVAERCFFVPIETHFEDEAAFLQAISK